MKKIITTILLFNIMAGSFAQKDNPEYDEKLAASLGGDDYGMKSYILVILKTGKNTTSDKKITDSLFRGHMDNINRLAQSGKLVVAGPLGKNDKTYRGIFILNAKTEEEATAMLQMDPAIKANIFETEIFTWYGSAALPEYLKAHSKIEKKKF
ncbi:YciI family protein [Flavitalea sp.]|nr:YciI family protein [Flavitalea sp.]